MTEDIEELIFRSERLASLCWVLTNNRTDEISPNIIESLKDASRTVLLICKRLEKQ